MEQLSSFLFLPKSGALSRMEPRVKLLLFLMLVSLLFFLRSWQEYVPLYLLLFLAVALSNISLRHMLRFSAPAIGITFVFVLFSIVFYRGPATTIYLDWRWITLTKEGLESGGLLTLRVFALLILSYLYTLTSSPSNIVNGLEGVLGFLSRLRLPIREFIMILTIAFSFLPILLQEAARLAAAQRVRGAAPTSRGLLRRSLYLVSVLLPLFLSLYRRAEELALAMESRCYLPGMKRSKLNPLTISAVDVLAVVTVGGTALCIWLT